MMTETSTPLGTQHLKDANPSGEQPFCDLSQDFVPHKEPTIYVVAAACPGTHRVQEGDGRDGFRGYEQHWEITVMADGPETCSSFDNGNDLPAELRPYRSVTLGGLCGGPRWSHQGRTDFIAGKPARPDLPELLHDAVTRRVKFSSPADAWIVVAYTLFTYLFMLFPRVPFLRFASLQPGSGKTTALRLSELLTFNAEAMSGVTMGAFKRLASYARGTLIVDEAERLANRNDELTLVANARAERGSRFRQIVTRGEGVEVESLDLFGPLIYASLTQPIASIDSRSITIDMVPLGEGDLGDLPVGDDVADWLALRDEQYLWARGNWRRVRQTYLTDPSVRVGVGRRCDLWVPILAVARQFSNQDVFNEIRRHAEAIQRRSDRPNLVDDFIVQALWAEVEAATDSKLQIDVKALRTVATAIAAFVDEAPKIRSARIRQLAEALGCQVRRSGGNGCDQVHVADVHRFKSTLIRTFPHLVALFADK